MNTGNFLITKYNRALQKKRRASFAKRNKSLKPVVAGKANLTTALSAAEKAALKQQLQERLRQDKLLLKSVKLICFILALIAAFYFIKLVFLNHYNLLY